MLQPKVILNNQYRIEATIGQGGFGHVYRARDLLTGETVAIKELIPTFAHQSPMVQRFLQEARATMNLTHPHIARTYHTFHDGETYYLVMEYLPDGSLADRLQRGPLPPDEAVRIAIALCQALEYAHHHGVIHCDIKPANILFDAQGNAHLADFGIAHVPEELLTGPVRTLSGALIGTVRYMSPEQLDGVRDDPRLDLYALGAILYEMLAGRPYLDFEAETTPAAHLHNMQRIKQEPPRPLLTVNPAVPPWLAQVVDRALRKNPDERFPSAKKMRKALKSPPALLKLVLPDGREIPLGGKPLTLGRKEICDIVLDNDYVSRRHVTIQITETGVRVTDLDSKNGTFVNGVRLVPHAAHLLQPGDTLQLGKTLKIQVRSGTAPPKPPADNTLSRKEWTILIGAAVTVVAVFAVLLILAIKASNQPASPTPTSSSIFITAAPSIPSPTRTPTFTYTPTPPPTATPSPTLSPSPTSPPTKNPKAPPTPFATLTPDDPLIPIIQQVIRNYAQIKAVAVGQTHDESLLPTVLIDHALREQRDAVRWQRDHNVYYEITLHWMRYDWFQRLDETHAQALVTKRETILYFIEGEQEPREKASCRDCEYQAFYELKWIDGQWYISEKDSYPYR